MPVCRLLLLWVGVMLLPAFLSRETSTIQMIGAAPALYLLAAVGVWESYRWAVVERTANKRWQLGIAAVIGVLISPRIVDFTFPLCYFLTMNVPALMATYCQLRQREYLLRITRADRVDVFKWRLDRDSYYLALPAMLGRNMIQVESAPGRTFYDADRWE